MRDILFNIPFPFGRGVLPIHSYGVMAMIGFLLAVIIARWRARRLGVSPDHVMDVAVWALLAGIVGSRIAYVLQNADFYLNTSRPGWSFFDIFKIWEGGLVFYGGLIGALIVTVIVIRIRRLKMLEVLDILAPSVAIGHAFGRIGCFLRGCCYGAPVDSHAWYGVVFPNDALAYDPKSLCPIPLGTPLFPTQILSSIDLFIIFTLLMLYFPRRKNAGEVTAVYLLLYSVERFIVEFFRGDTHLPGEISPAQWISLFAFFGGLALFAYARSRPPIKPVTNRAKPGKT